MKEYSRIAIALFIFSLVAPFATAESAEKPSHQQFLRNQNDIGRSLNDDNSRQTKTTWRWVTPANLSTFTEYEVLRFEIPESIHKLGSGGLHRRLNEDELLVQEDATPELNADDLIVSVTFSEICKSLKTERCSSLRVIGIQT